MGPIKRCQDVSRFATGEGPRSSTPEMTLDWHIGVVQCCLCVVLQATNAFHRFRAWRIFLRVMQARWTVQKQKSGPFCRCHLRIKFNWVLKLERVLPSKNDQSNLHPVKCLTLRSIWRRHKFKQLESICSTSPRELFREPWKRQLNWALE